MIQFGNILVYSLHHGFLYDSFLTLTSIEYRLYSNRNGKRFPSKVFEMSAFVRKSLFISAQVIYHRAVCRFRFSSSIQFNSQWYLRCFIAILLQQGRLDVTKRFLVKEGNEITRIGIVANSSTAQRRKNRENRLVTKTSTVRVLHNQCRREAVRSTALRIFDLHLIIDLNRFPHRIALNVSSDFWHCFKYRRNESWFYRTLKQNYRR